MEFLKSRAVAEVLGVPYHRIYELLRGGKLSPPQKDSSGDYVWLPADLDRVRAALAAGRRNRKAVPA